MKKIENSEQLRAEIARLEELAKSQEQGLRVQIRGLREEFRPANMVMNAVSSMTGIKINKNEFLKNGLAFGLSMVLQRFVFKTETSFERKIYGWVDELFDKVKSVINKFSTAGSVGSERIEKDKDQS
ncbi:MAG TPA: hypothetical protein PLU53_01710 [Bacteroidia bacterium]|nr:hypothetical protein [Bacteroidia bacterium]